VAKPSKVAAVENGRRSSSVTTAVVTMRTIAGIAGVSAMTVSRALKAESLVSKATRDRVLAAVERTGYLPDATARVFATRRSGFVAVLIPALNHSNFADTLHGMSEAFDAAGLQILLGDTRYAAPREESLIAALLQRRPEAIVLTSGVHTARTRAMLASAGVPVVEIWDLPKQAIGSVVGFSNQEAGAAMARYLHAQGRRRIGFIGGGASRDTRGAERRVGFQRAIRELGLPRGRIVGIGEPPSSMTQGAEGLDIMLRQWPDTDAIACVSDLLAFGVLAECQRLGIAVPSRLALVGFGDFEVARCCHPRLTTIAVDCRGIGRRAGEVALRAIEARRRGERFAPETTALALRIVERETA
jgi:LacI family gluconate utilization system Gnt-I transcriptional repressor